MSDLYTFKRFLSRNWWFLLFASGKLFNQSQNNNTSGSVLFDILIFGGILLALMWVYWYVRYGRHISTQSKMPSTALPEQQSEPKKPEVNKGKVIGFVTIKFYNEDNASVEYTSDAMTNETRESDLVQMFTLYYAKMLFNLDRSEGADLLIKYITAAGFSVFNNGSPQRNRVLASGLKLVEQGTGKVTKTYSGEMIQKSDGTRVILTNMDTVGEGYYAPTSTIMFLQFLINSLSDNALLLLVTSIAGMTKYYREVGDYSKIESILEAPYYGGEYALKTFSKQ